MNREERGKHREKVFDMGSSGVILAFYKPSCDGVPHVSLARDCVTFFL